MLLEVAPVERRHLEPKVLRQTSVPLANPGLASTRKVLERRKAEESASGEVFQEIRRHMGQSWERSQLEDELEEREMRWTGLRTRG